MELMRLVKVLFSDKREVGGRDNSLCFDSQYNHFVHHPVEKKKYTDTGMARH